MPFRARLHPLSLVRRQAAAQRFVLHTARASAPPLATPQASSFAGPGPNTLQCRAYNTTAAAQLSFADFFSGRKSQKAAQEGDAAVDKFMALVGRRSSQDLTRSYTALVAQINSGGCRRLTADELDRVLRFLSDGHPSSFTVTFLQALFDDMERLHHVEAEPRHYRSLISGLARNDNGPRALEIARSLHDSVGVVTEQEWSDILRATLRRPNSAKDSKAINEVLTAAKLAGANSERLYSTVLTMPTARELSSKAAAKEAAKLYARMDKDGVAPGPWCEARLVDAQLGASVASSVKATVDSWRAADNVDDAELQQFREEVTLRLEMARKDRAAIEALLHEGVPHARPSEVSKAFTFAVQDRLNGVYTTETVVDAIEEVATATGQQFSTEAWTLLISTVDELGHYDVAYDLYELARARMSTLDDRLAKQIIRSLCNKYDEPRLDEAMSMYHHLVDSNPNINIAILRKIYEMLFSSCAKHASADYSDRNTAGYVASSATKSAILIADDALRRGIQISKTSAGRLIDIMTGAKDHPEAFDVYRRISYVLDPPLDGNQIDQVAAAFIKLRWAGSVVPNPEYVKAFIDDMSWTGVAGARSLLMALLNTYAYLAKEWWPSMDENADRRFAIDALLHATRDVHHLIMLDSAVPMEIPLLTALMDALSSCGAFGEAFEVWREIVIQCNKRLRDGPKISEQLMAPAISVALDSAGWGHDPAAAHKIWSWASRHNLLSHKNWETWTECLCRLGLFEEALNVVTNQMGHNGNPPATAGSVMVIMKFVTRDRHRHLMPHVGRQLREKCPQLYDQVKSSIIIDEF